MKCLCAVCFFRQDSIVNLSTTQFLSLFLFPFTLFTSFDRSIDMRQARVEANKREREGAHQIVKCCFKNWFEDFYSLLISILIEWKRKRERYTAQHVWACTSISRSSSIDSPLNKRDCSVPMRWIRMYVCTRYLRHHARARTLSVRLID